MDGKSGGSRQSVESRNITDLTQIWGFQNIDGKRYYCRNVVVRKDGKEIRDRLVYDYQS
jgi:hypothetical protein